MNNGIKTHSIDEAIGRLADMLFLKIGGSGTPLDEIASAEQKLGFPIPETLKLFLQTVGGHPVFMSSQNKFLRPSDFYERNGGIVFCEERQGHLFWGIRRSDLGHDDPPVVQGNQDEVAWHADATRLSSFLLQMFCWQVLNALPNMGSTEVGDQNIDRLQSKRFELAGADSYDLTTYCDCGWVACYFAPQKMLYVGALSDEELESFEEQYDIDTDWL